MMFWFKKKEYVIDCFTTDSYAFEYCKISPAVRYYPEWFKRLPSMVEHNNNPIPSVKHCLGLKELYKNSFVIPFWTTASFKISNAEELWFQYDSTSKILIHEHPLVQMSGYLPEQKIGHLKIYSPWYIKSKDFVQFHWGEPIWNNNRLNDITLAPGVIDFKYQHGVNLNYLFDYRDKERIITFEPNTAMGMLTPLVSEDVTVKMVCHQITENEVNKYGFNLRLRPKSPWVPGIFESIYLKKKRFLDKHEEEKRKDKKCPFGFGKK